MQVLDQPFACIHLYCMAFNAAHQAQHMPLTWKSTERQPDTMKNDVLSGSVRFVPLLGHYQRQLCLLEVHDAIAAPRRLRAYSSVVQRYHRRQPMSEIVQYQVCHDLLTCKRASMVVLGWRLDLKVSKSVILVKDSAIGKNVPKTSARPNHIVAGKSSLPRRHSAFSCPCSSALSFRSQISARFCSNFSWSVLILLAYSLRSSINSLYSSIPPFCTSYASLRSVRYLILSCSLSARSFRSASTILFR